MLLPALAGTLAVIIHVWLFTHGSRNNDEVVYLTQARLISQGHLLLRAGDDARPWFFAAGPHGLVPKYLPTVGGCLGVSRALTGSVVPALALSAAGLASITLRLCRQLLGERHGTWACLMVVLSPLTIIESALALSYVPFLFLVCAVWSLLLDLRSGTSRPGIWASIIGLLAVVAAATRPYDSLLLLAPALFVVLPEIVRAYGVTVWLRRVVLPAAVGAAPPTAAVLAYNSYATGHALKLPFGMLEPADALGFGDRRLFPEDGIHRFGPWQSAQGAFAHFLVEPLTWYALGAVLIPLALLRLAAWRRLEVGVKMMAASGVGFFLGYLLFWGPWNASVIWGGTRVVGPFYALALLVPVVVLMVDLVSAHGWTTKSRARPILVGLGTVAACLAGAQMVFVVVHARRDDTVTRTVLADIAIGMKPVGSAAVTLLNVDPAYLGHPVGTLVNDDATSRYRLAARAKVSALLTTDTDLLQLPGDPYANEEGLVAMLASQQVVTGRELRLHVLTAGRSGGMTLVSMGGTAPVLCPMGSAEQGASVIVTAGRVSCSGSYAPDAGLLRVIGGDRLCAAAASCLDVVYVTGHSGAQQAHAARPLPLTTSNGSLQLLADERVLRAQGDGWIGVTATPV